MKKKYYYVYAAQTTNFRALVEADSVESANNLAHRDDDLYWDEVGELDWELLDENTEETKDES